MSVNGYNFAAEIFSLLLAFTILYLCVATKPRRTPIFSIIVTGLIVGVVNIVLHDVTVALSHDTYFVPTIWYKLLVIGYYLSYLLILMLLFTYVHLLAYKQRSMIENLYAVLMMFSGAYVIAMGAIFSKGLYITVVGGRYQLTDFFNANLIFGLIDVVLITGSAIVNRKSLPRVLLNYLALFIVGEVALIVTQIYKEDTLFLGVTYIAPFMLFYVVFHSIMYDEMTGCQNKAALESHYFSINKKKQKFAILYVKFPRMEYIDNEELLLPLKIAVSKFCRRLEKADHGARVYSVNEFTYAIVIERRDEKKIEEVIAFAHSRIKEAIAKWEVTHRPEYTMVVIKNNHGLINISQLESFANYLFEKADRKKVNYYEAVEKDFEASEKRRKIEKVIVDIRNKNNLNDPRIIVYTQPIFDVKRETYHSAEALMRLEVDGEIVPPNVFIPLAEKNGCIHTLTRIILNKVCRRVYELQDYYLFDAISVNVSLSEFMDYCLHDELIDIIEGNGIKCNKIRLEMTESMTSDEMEAITHNMEEFNRAGVSFYLDDFGTGYSNLERIVSLPFKTIKFDKSLLYKSLDDPILLQLIENMVDVFKNHEMIVLVEGVENEEQADLSKDLGFEYIQGYNYSPPVPIGEIETFFEKKGKAV